MKSFLATFVERLRDRLAYIDALPQLTLLGLVTGILAGGVIVLFRWAIEWPLDWLLPGHGDSLEGLSQAGRFAVPLLGALTLGLLLHWLPPAWRPTGIGHVLDRMHNHQGRMPLGNMVHQFLGGAWSLISGQSVGREGPAVHLGAGCGSVLGQWLRLPNNSLRPLAGCGVAAAIAASFNTPMAGVIFAMEVVMLQYTIAGFIPVIMAAVAGTTITHLAFGGSVALIVPPTAMSQLSELPLLAVLGLLAAVVSALFIRLQVACSVRFQNLPIWVRFGAAGLLTGTFAMSLPQVLGMGYATIDHAVAGQLGIVLLLAILVAKALASAVSLGVGIPGGVVGPCLVMGAVLGAAVQNVAQMLLPGTPSEVTLYVVLGMGAVMAAVLNAPLAAMMTILELTYNPHTLFPGMLVVVTACLATRSLFQCDGLFPMLLRAQNRWRSSQTPEVGGLATMLTRVGVRSVMARHIVASPLHITPAQAQSLLSSHPQWLVLEGDLVLHPADLLAYCAELADPEEATPIDLTEIPARRWQTTAVDLEANLMEVLQAMNEAQVDVACVKRRAGARCKGVVTREQIENYYRL